MLFQPFTFTNGKIAKNRFFKSAMEEQLAKHNQPTNELVRLYDTWAKGGIGISVTGNVMVAENGKGSINDVVITDERSMDTLKAWAKAGTQNDTLLIMQINHAGKQSPKAVNKTPVAPSAVPLRGMDGFINPPRALADNEIETIIQEFIRTAKIAEQAGFSGVQIHGAHGYLVSQFLSPHHNQRTDKWGGSLENRMRFLVEIYQGIRAVVSPSFLVGLKLNSADFQKGGFDENDSIQVVQKMSELGIDFIEISGGNYESPAMMSTKASTKQREAFFIDYAEKARAVSQVPLIITGGFRSEQAMNDALQSGHLDLVGVARPLALVPDLPNKIKNGTYQTITTERIKTGFAPVDKKLGAVLEMDWYMYQMALIGQGKQPNPKLSPWKVLAKTIIANGKAGLSTGRS
ncbi:NADH:flavin oxidoreductase/NADH oxidase family protein [Moraxella porci]|uniref:NADH:flavin oxidoreductase/NADH oxidase family protein n=1 Tax=Moraxella porci TaxID=1288392 RepID=UPI002447EA28|nr:NADH:flavin oxidoreductase/NADH oxidase family protein [Moraxella porci]MDH2273172.1 NADH:flavin oxidoreductase/NADH oxidase family protein [Moraxella porci]